MYRLYNNISLNSLQLIKRNHISVFRYTFGHVTRNIHRETNKWIKIGTLFCKITLAFKKCITYVQIRNGILA